MSANSQELTVYTGQPPAIRAARRWLQVQNEAIGRRLAPFGIGAERYQALVLTELARSDQLLQCMQTEKGQASLQVAVYHMAQLGMEPGPLGHAYLLPFYRSKERFMAATFVLGWKGMVQLALRSPNVRDVDVQPVYQGDKFSWRRGTRPSIDHVPVYEGPPNYDRLTHVYAVCHTRNGGRPFVVLSREQIEHYRHLSKQPDGEAWRNNPVAMGLKTGIRRGFPLWPVRVQEQQAVIEDAEREESLDDEDAGDGAGEQEPAANRPAPVRAGRDRRRRQPQPEQPAPPDEPAQPGARGGAEPPPSDAPSDSSAAAGSAPRHQEPPPPDQPPDQPHEVRPQQGGSMTPLQFLDFVCEQIDVDRERLLQALHGAQLTLPPSADQVRAAVKAAQAIGRGEARLLEVEGAWQVLPVTEDDPTQGGLPL